MTQSKLHPQSQLKKPASPNTSSSDLFSCSETKQDTPTSQTTFRNLLDEVFSIKDERRKQFYLHRQELTKSTLKRASYVHLVFILLFVWLTEYPLVLISLLVFQNLVNGCMFYFLKRVQSLAKIEVFVLCRILITFVINLVIQLTHGPLFPVWIMYTVAIILQLNIYYFQTLVNIFNSSLSVVLNQLSLFLSFYLNRQARNVGYLFRGVERQCPSEKFLGTLTVDDLQPYYVVSILAIHLTAILIGVIFADLSRAREEEHMLQSAQVLKEKLLNLEKVRISNA